MASQITSVSVVYSTVCSGADKKNQSSASLAFVRGIHLWPVNSPHKRPVTREMFPFDDVIVELIWHQPTNHGIVLAYIKVQILILDKRPMPPSTLVSEAPEIMLMAQRTVRPTRDTDAIDTR